MILAIEAATPRGSLALVSDGAVLAEEFLPPGPRASGTYIAAVEALFPAAGAAAADIRAVAVSAGPGAFTGLRVGIVTARTIAALGGGFPASIAVPKGVCSLDVVARQAVHFDDAPRGEFVVASDARRHELYWARYGADGVRIGEAEVGAAGTLPDLPIVGPGADLYPEVLGNRAVAGPRSLDAGVLAASIDVLPDAGIEPLYLRKPDAAVPSTRKSTLVTPRLSRR